MQEVFRTDTKKRLTTVNSSNDKTIQCREEKKVKRIVKTVFGFEAECIMRINSLSHTVCANYSEVQIKIKKIYMTYECVFV